MRDWASSGRVKIDRADEHVRHLEGEISDFRKRHPYIIEIQSHPQGWNTAFPDGSVAFVVREREVVPIPWSAIVADAIHNLNVALDHLWQRALYGPKVVRNDHFPVFKSPDCAKARFGPKVKGRCKAAVDILNRVKAFEVGNPFWVIREFDDADKHDTMVLVACLLKGADVRTKHHGRLMFGEFVPPWADHIARPAAIPLKDGTILLITSPSGQEVEVDVDHELAVEIAFGDSEVLKGEPVIPTLKNLTAAVDSLVSAFVAAGLLT